MVNKYAKRLRWQRRLLLVWLHIVDPPTVFLSWVGRGLTRVFFGAQFPQRALAPLVGYRDRLHQNLILRRKDGQVSNLNRGDYGMLPADYYPPKQKVAAKPVPPTPYPKTLAELDALAKDSDKVSRLPSPPRMDVDSLSKATKAIETAEKALEDLSKLQNERTGSPASFVETKRRCDGIIEAAKQIKTTTAAERQSLDDSLDALADELLNYSHKDPSFACISEAIQALNDVLDRTTPPMKFKTPAKKKPAKKVAKKTKKPAKKKARR